MPDTPRIWTPPVPEPGGEKGHPKLESIDDLLTDEERGRLTADLARIHKTMYPCWEPRR